MEPAFLCQAKNLRHTGPFDRKPDRKTAYTSERTISPFPIRAVSYLMTIKSFEIRLYSAVYAYLRFPASALLDAY